ncbi:hypothetical protein TNCT_455001 [Trichonephila clavata]|uniref:Uncharacterized protein n=1 Tax=Trichonephila clavata TaxID=2740835 RepID=A0A8X6HJW2_TRICU|nr:hypothetical protein TNCT_455001 [Trichonephila clavata]
MASQNFDHKSDEEFCFFINMQLLHCAMLCHQMKASDARPFVFMFRIVKGLLRSEGQAANTRAGIAINQIHQSRKNVVREILLERCLAATVCRMCHRRHSSRHRIIFRLKAPVSEVSLGKNTTAVQIVRQTVSPSSRHRVMP